MHKLVCSWNCLKWLHCFGSQLQKYIKKKSENQIWIVHRIEQQTVENYLNGLLWTASIHKIQPRIQSWSNFSGRVIYFMDFVYTFLFILMDLILFYFFLYSLRCLSFIHDMARCSCNLCVLILDWEAYTIIRLRKATTKKKVQPNILVYCICIDVCVHMFCYSCCLAHQRFLTSIFRLVRFSLVNCYLVYFPLLYFSPSLFLRIFISSS